MTKQVLTQQHGGVLEIRLNRPEKYNALTGAMYDALSDGLNQAAEDKAIRALLLTAEGPAFCAGNDIGEFLAASGDFAASPQARFIRAVATSPKPMVAAVQGQAVGVGATMLLHCDLVYAAAGASLSTPFVDMGLVPEAGSSVLLPARLGGVRAAALLLLCEPLCAEAAQMAGLINAVLPADELRAHALMKAHALARKPPQALGAARALMRGDRAALEAHMQRELEAFARALRGPEAHEAFAAFVEKRAPDFASLTIEDSQTCFT